MKDKQDALSREMNGLEKGARDFIAHVQDVANASIQGGALTPGACSDLARWKVDIKIYFDSIAIFIESIRATRGDIAADFQYECLWNITSSAFFIGSRGTISEDSERYVRLKQAKIAGSVSGAARRKNAQETWKLAATKMAKDARQKYPGYSQDKVVEEIQAYWKEPNIEPPGSSRLKQHVSQLEKDGEIPRAVRQRTGLGS